MTLHAKNCKPGCINFCFMNFFFRGGDPPLLVMPLKVGGGIFYGKEEGYGMTLHAKNCKPVCFSFRFMNLLFSEGGPPP